MKTDCEAAMKEIAKKAAGSSDSGDAMRFTQAALNLAHAMSVLKMDQPSPPLMPDRQYP